MQTIQNILTLAIEATVIIGFGGIFLHYLYTTSVGSVKDLYKGYIDSEWTDEQKQFTKEVVEAHKAEVAAKSAPSYNYACPLTCELPEIKPAPKARKTRKSTKKEVKPETATEKVKAPMKPRKAKAA